MCVEEKISTLKQFQEIHFSFSVNQFPSGQIVEKGNMLLLTKETTHKELSLKTQFLKTTDSRKVKKIRGEPIWKKFWLFW